MKEQKCKDKFEFFYEFDLLENPLNFIIKKEQKKYLLLEEFLQLFIV